MGRFASSLTWGVCDSNMPGNDILPAGVGDLAGVFCSASSTPAYTTVAMGAGAAAGCTHQMENLLG